MYPNMDHVLVRNGGSPFAELDRYFFLYERPVLNLCNARVDATGSWTSPGSAGFGSCSAAQRGNMSFSYDGMPLPHPAAVERPAASAGAGILGAGPQRHPGRHRRGAGDRPVPAGAAVAGDQPAARQGPQADRLYGDQPDAVDGLPDRRARRRAGARLRATGPGATRSRPACGCSAGSITGNYNKGTLAGWGIDVRDPTADRRLVEFCLTVPLETISARRQSAARSPAPPSPTGCRRRSSTRGARAIRRPTGTKA